MRIRKFAFLSSVLLPTLVAFGGLAAPSNAPSVVDIALANDVVSREPQGRFPTVTCSASRSGDAPVVDTARNDAIYLWMRVSSEEDFVLRHRWFKDGVRVRTVRTYTSLLDRIVRIVDEVTVGLGWKELAGVELKVGGSEGWRTWSKKELDRLVHAGEWRVDAVLPNDTVICSVYFSVR